MRGTRTLTRRCVLAVSAVIGTVAACWLTQAATWAQPAWTWISEPQAGFRPWQQALQQATTGVDFNAYLLTDRPHAKALIRLADRGIPVRII